MSEVNAEAELQQAAATGAAAAVGAVADDQRIAADAEAARLAAEASAQIAQTAAMASEMAAEAATTAISDAGSAQLAADSAVQQAGSVHDEVSGLRAEFASQIGDLAQSVRSLLTMKEQEGSVNQVTSVKVDGDKPEPQSSGGESGSTGTAEGSAAAGGGTSERRKRHKFGRRLFRRACARCTTAGRSRRLEEIRSASSRSHC